MLLSSSPSHAGATDFGDFLFDDCQHFFLSRAGHDYDLPADGPLKNYTEKIEGQPLLCGPTVFGLHSNAEIGYFNIAAKGLWRNMIELQPRTAATSGEISREEYIETIAKDIQSSVPGQHDLVVLRNSFGTPNPIQIVLLQELERWNALTSKLGSSLSDLRKALVGEIGMSEELDQLGASLFNGFLPSMWAALAPKSEKPLGSW